MTFRIVVEIVLLIAALFFAVCSIGMNEPKSGERSVVLTAVFVTAFLLLMVLGGK